jgi:hypothetical protein
VPLRATVWGLFAALSLIVIDPDRAPGAVGVKVTVTVQLLPAASELPQVFVCEKSPVATMLESVSAAVPPLVTDTDCGVLAVCSP